MTSLAANNTVLLAPVSRPVTRTLPARGGSEEQRQRILRAATDALAAHGYQAVRLRDIAQAAGVSIGLLQHYFETRDELMLRAFERSSMELLDRWAEVTRNQTDPWRRIAALVEQLSDDPLLRRHCQVWIEFSAGAARHPELRSGFLRVYFAWRGLLTEAIEEGVRQGMFHPALEPGEVADLLVTTVDGCEIAVAAGTDTLDAERLRALVLRTAALALGVPLEHAERNGR
jgi:AcrR family transcriptional regulator